MADNGDATAVAGEPASTGGDTFDAPASATALENNTEPIAPTTQLGDSEEPRSASDILKPDDTASCETLETTLNKPLVPLADSEMSDEISQAAEREPVSENQQTENLDTSQQMEQPAGLSDTTEIPPSMMTSESHEPSEPTLDTVPSVPEPATLNQNEAESTVLETDDVEMAVAEEMVENTEAKPDKQTNDTFKSSELPPITPVATEISLNEAVSSELPQTEAILPETSQEEPKKSELPQSEAILDISEPSELPPSDPVSAELPSTDVIPSEVAPGEPLSSELSPTETIPAETTPAETTLTEPMSAMQPSIDISTTVKAELIDELAEPGDVEMAEPLMTTEPKTETPDGETELEPPLDIDEPMATDVPAEHMTTDKVDSVPEAGKPACVGRTEEARGGGEEEEERTVTMLDVLQEQEALEDSAGAVLGGSDDNNCTYAEGYIKRQALYACMTCCSEAKEDPTKRAGVCLACSLTCHENHELIELYTKRDFRCDCGNPNFNSNRCNFTKEKNDLNVGNKYNQNFSGLYCICHRPYPDPESSVDDEMIQCIVCEDWLHTSHLDAIVPANDHYSEMICKLCMEKNDFLHDYTCYAVVVEEKVLDVVSSVDKINESENESPTKTPEAEQTLHSGSMQVEGQVSPDQTLADNGKEGTNQVIHVLGENSLKKSTNEGNEESLQDSTKEVTSNEACESKVTTDIVSDGSNKEILEEENNDTSNDTSVRTEENSVPMEQENQDDKNVEDAIINPHISEPSTKNKLDEEKSLEEKSEKDTTSLDNSSPENVALKETLQESHEVSSEPVQVESHNETDVNNLSEKKTEGHDSDISDESIRKESAQEDNLSEKKTEGHDSDISDESILKESAQEDKSCKTSEEKKLPNETIEVQCGVSATNDELKPTDITTDIKTDNIVKEADCDVNTIISEKKNSVLHDLPTQSDELKLTDISADKKTDNVDKEAVGVVNTNINENKDSEPPVLPTQDDGKVIGDSLVSNVEPSGTDIDMNNDTTSVNLPMESESKTCLDMETAETEDKTSDENLTKKVVEVAIDVEMKDDSASISGDVILPKDTVESSTIVCNQNTDIDTTAENEMIENGDKVTTDIKLNGDVHQEDIAVETTNKRKLSTEIIEEVDHISVKKVKLDNGVAENCRRPTPEVKKVFKGATFWPCSWRQKLCSCHNCVSMYRDSSVLFLLDLEDTVSAYEELGKAKNGGKLSQYEKGLEALSSLDRIQQINALTEYNKMKDDLLDFLISFKNRQEVVKVEDIEKFFADIKPKRKSDGVYFCR